MLTLAIPPILWLLDLGRVSTLSLPTPKKPTPVHTAQPVTTQATSALMQARTAYAEDYVLPGLSAKALYLHEETKGNDNHQAAPRAATGNSALQANLKGSKEGALVLPSPQTQHSLFAIQNTEKKVVACVGDSITYGWGASIRGKTDYPAQLQMKLGGNYIVHNYGEPCKTVACAKWSLVNANVSSSGNSAEEWAPYITTDSFKKSSRADADIVIIMLGTNDATDACFDTHTIAQEYGKLIAAYNSSKIFVVAPPPSLLGLTCQNFAGKLPPLIKQIAAENGVTYVGGLQTTFRQPCGCPLIVGECDYFDYGDNVHPNDKGYEALADVLAEALA